jgi:hypothetical protein
MAVAKGKSQKGKPKDDPTRASVMAALLAGQGVNEIARALKLAKSTVSRYKNELLPSQLEQVGTQKRDKITALIEAHLETSLTCANTLAKKAASNQKWFAQQSAEGIAVLYGVLSDKAIRILEAIEPAEEANDEEAE